MQELHHWPLLAHSMQSSGLQVGWPVGGGGLGLGLGLGTGLGLGLGLGTGLGLGLCTGLGLGMVALQQKSMAA